MQCSVHSAGLWVDTCQDAVYSEGRLLTGDHRLPFHSRLIVPTESPFCYQTSCSIPSTSTCLTRHCQRHLDEGKCSSSTHTSESIANMLTYPDRQRFEQIRAQWETAQPSDEGQADMAGWRDKPTPRPPACVDSHENGGSKFRRKLSNGFSRITNPLSQRKVTPDRSQLEAPPLATTESLTTATSVYDDPVLPAQKSTSLVDLARKSKDKAGSTLR